MKSLAVTAICVLIQIISFAQEEDSSIAIHQNICQDTLAPRFDIFDVNGNHWVSDSLRGKIVVLNFWSIYCPACYAELTELNKLPSDFSSDSVIFISVVFENTPKADSIISRHNFNYHLVEGGLPIHGDFYNNCYPTHIIIDKHGMIRFNVCGTVNEKMMKAKIAEVGSKYSE
ncbi:MAG TPA: TlpA disulfide reductase family protein [Bacteroidia bacterium]|nr:TlpA disulfide reductase family protein [Bacteroidia bacterium]